MADFITAINLDRRGQIAGGNAVKMTAHDIQRPYQHITQPPHGTAGDYDQHQYRTGHQPAGQGEGALIRRIGFTDVGAHQLQILDKIGFKQVLGFLRRLVHKRLQVIVLQEANQLAQGIAQPVIAGLGGCRQLLFLFAVTRYRQELVEIEVGFLQ
ncbi:hypothetical protein D3C73_1020020 [compost metagenome]